MEATGKKVINSFEEKLLKIWDSILNRYEKSFKVTAFNNLSFKAYIMYLYKILNGIDLSHGPFIVEMGQL